MSDEHNNISASIATHLFNQGKITYDEYLKHLDIPELTTKPPKPKVGE